MNKFTTTATEKPKPDETWLQVKLPISIDVLNAVITGLKPLADKQGRRVLLTQIGDHIHFIAK